jgi:chromosome transmission fidelity protein 4
MVRVYKTGSDGEPTNIDDCQENNTAIAATVSLGGKHDIEH